MSIIRRRYENGQYVFDREEFKGAVLDTRERNGYDDSDFYAVVWDESEQTVREVEYGTTRFPCGDDAVIDATDDVKEKARAYVKARVARMLRVEFEERALEPSRGSRVSFEGDRTGTVFWVGEVIPPWRRHYQNAHKRGFATKRVGVRDDEGRTYWFNADDVTVLDPEPVDEARIEELAANASEDFGALSRLRSAARGMLVM